MESGLHAQWHSLQANWLSLLNTYQLHIAFVVRDKCLEYFSIAVTKQTINKHTKKQNKARNLKIVVPESETL